MSCSECSKKQRGIVKDVMFHLDLLWHYARVLPEEDRHRFADLFGRGITKIGHEPEKALAEAIDILVHNGVELIIRSTTQEIRFEPRYADTGSTNPTVGDKD